MLSTTPEGMRNTETDLTENIAARVAFGRKARGYSLDALAARSSVSRSMISLIERAESSPTAAVLDRLARALGVTLASLFEPLGGPAGANPVSGPANRTSWRDPESGYVRCNVSPPGVPQPMQIVEVRFPPGRRVAFDMGPRNARVYQQVWVLEGAINITLGEKTHALKEGDCLAMELDRPNSIHNPTRRVTRYAIVVASEPLTLR